MEESDLKIEITIWSEANGVLVHYRGDALREFGWVGRNGFVLENPDDLGKYLVFRACSYAPIVEPLDPQ